MTDLPAHLTPAMRHIATHPGEWHSRATLIAAGIPKPANLSSYLNESWQAGLLERRFASGAFEYRLIRLPRVPTNIDPARAPLPVQKDLVIDLTLHAHPVVSILIANPGRHLTSADVQHHLPGLKRPDSPLSYAVRRGYLSARPGPHHLKEYTLLDPDATAKVRAQRREERKRERQEQREAQRQGREERIRLKNEQWNARRREMRQQAAPIREQVRQARQQEREALRKAQQQEREERRAAREQAVAAKLAAPKAPRKAAPKKKVVPPRPAAATVRAARHAREIVQREDAAHAARQAEAQARLELTQELIRQDTPLVLKALTELARPASEKDLLPATGLLRGRLKHALAALEEEGKVRSTKKYGGAVYEPVISPRTSVPAEWTPDARRVHEHLSTRAADTTSTMSRELRLTRQQIEDALDVLHALGQLVTRPVGHSFVYATPPQETRNAAD